MLIAEIANRAELTAVVTSELREIYGIKHRREKNHHQKVLQVCYQLTVAFHFFFFVPNTCIQITFVNGIFLMMNEMIFRCISGE